jgi:hypothetical protein
MGESCKWTYVKTETLDCTPGHYYCSAGVDIVKLGGAEAPGDTMSEIWALFAAARRCRSMKAITAGIYRTDEHDCI